MYKPPFSYDSKDNQALKCLFKQSTVTYITSCTVNECDIKLVTTFAVFWAVLFLTNETKSMLHKENTSLFAAYIYTTRIYRYDIGLVNFIVICKWRFKINILMIMWMLR